MKLAVPVRDGNKIDEHFGHCEYYKVFTISENNEIIGERIILAPDGCGCKSDIASVLAKDGVTVMLAGGIGAGAIDVLNQSGIEVVRGCSGEVEQVVKQYITGLITDSGETCKQHETHHGDGHGHNCNH